MKWRPIKSAPRDDHILLLYPSFADPSERVVNQGRWVEVPHENQIMEALANHLSISIPKPPFDGHWEVAWVAIISHGGIWNGHGYEARQARVEPTHWKPMPN